MRCRIAVTGKKGQVVQSLKERTAHHAKFDLVTLGLPEVDLSKPEDIENAIIAVKPDLIVSAAAFTAVDSAETSQELAHIVNSVAVGKIGGTAASLNIPVIHLSTDYVFDGSLARPYLETDVVSPISVYGRTKLGGEMALAATTPNHVILRTSWVYSPFGKNFIKTMLALAETRDEISVVCDQVGSPTSALDIADAILQIADNILTSHGRDLRGIFHLAGTGETSWAEFAREIFAVSSENGYRSASVRPIPTSEYPTPASRPKNSRLNCSKIAQVHGICLPDWRQSSKTVVENILSSKKGSFLA